MQSSTETLVSAQPIHRRRHGLKLADADTLRERIVRAMPSAVVSPPRWDGPAGYYLLVRPMGGQPVRITSRQEWTRLHRGLVEKVP